MIIKFALARMATRVGCMQVVVLQDMTLAFGHPGINKPWAVMCPTSI